MTTTTRNPDFSNGTGTLRTVVGILHGMPASDGAGVKLTRLIGTPSLPDLDPFLMLDEFCSDTADDYLAGFPDHPHRGFETVTYMLAGRMRHGDNQGNTGLLRPGSVQWMTAGRGIVHSEMPEQEDGLMWGFQLWVNLPAKDKMTAPRYQDIEPDAIPLVTLENNAQVKVIAGTYGGARGPVVAESTDPTYLDISLPANTIFTHSLPVGHNAFVYVFEGDGDVTIGDASIQRNHIAVLGTGDTVSVSGGDSPARLLFIAGRPLREPIVKYGPFVMNTAEEIQQAIADFHGGLLT